MPHNNRHREHFNFRRDASWRVFRIMAEFIEGFQFLSDLKREVSVFGSTRYKPTDPYYKEARKLGRLLGHAGFTVVTGGGPGIMEAANRGAVETNANSVGLNIQLDKGQRTNRYVRKGMAFDYFFIRKVMLSASAQAYIFFPGGFGTLDEFFELVMLVQTKKMRPIPIVLVGRAFWEPLLNWVKTEVYQKFKNISEEDMSIYKLVDTAEEAFALVKDAPERPYF